MTRTRNEGMMSASPLLDVVRVSSDGNSTALSQCGDDSEEGGEVNNCTVGSSRHHVGSLGYARDQQFTEVDVNASSGMGVLSDSSLDSVPPHRCRVKSTVSTRLSSQVHVNKFSAGDPLLHNVQGKDLQNLLKLLE